MSLKIERKKDKVHIEYENSDNEFEPILISVEVDNKKFEECVKKERERKVEDPELNAIIEFVLFGEDNGC